MPRLSTTGLDDVIKMMENVGVNSERMAAQSLYSGAGLVAERLKQAILQLPADDNEEHRHSGGIKVISAEDREDLANGVGIAAFENKNGVVNTAVSIEGYTRRKEPDNGPGRRSYPNGVPLPMIARSIESGSSVRQKHPFVRQATHAMKQAVLTTMRNAAEAELQKIIEEAT